MNWCNTNWSVARPKHQLQSDTQEHSKHSFNKHAVIPDNLMKDKEVNLMYMTLHL